MNASAELYSMERVNGLDGMLHTGQLIANDVHQN